ncbi:PilZ domain-containing protein [Sphingomonas sp. PAMC 26621]|uniref:PilZ domain-containing protein n=1 Tax=Sphingomonas sp. PAMC 26621 TaxID=1112213 RepID=UPI0002898D23|nr:PilZ domain-containing protein [Sphingomonas sp. PAMC 26621]
MIRLHAAPPESASTEPTTPALTGVVSEAAPDGTSDDAEAERRLGDRVALTVGITLRERNWKAQPAGLIDLSRTGCRVNNLTIAAGTVVWVKLPGLEPFEAKVSWCQGWQCGIRFQQPMHPAVFDHFIARNAGVVVR